MKTVVILLSDKRSGSTMFQDALCAHHKVQTVEYSPHTYLETHHWLKGAVLLDFHRSLFANGKNYKNYGSRKNARIYLENELIKNVPNYKIPKDDKDLVFEGWEALCESFAKPIFFEKSPQHLAHWAALSLLFEWIQQTKKYKVKIIGLVRNPLAVQYSAFKLFRTLPDKRQYGWLCVHINLLAFKSLLIEDQFKLIRYEDIVDAPEKTLTAICNYIGIEYVPSMALKIHGNSKTKWNNDHYFNLILDPAVIKMAHSFGYAANVLENNNTSKITSWELFIWNIDTMFIKLKNIILNRLLMPMLLKFKLRK